jgi:Fe-S oxidoreductase
LDELIQKRADEKIFFHPHCHQRAEGLADDGLPSGTSATVEMLKVCGYDVEISEAGCCGMAGTFGYDAEHYDLSMKVGELKLLPMLRETNKPIASSGSACRLQIQQGAEKESAHPIMLIANLLR